METSEFGQSRAAQQLRCHWLNYIFPAVLTSLDIDFICMVNITPKFKPEEEKKKALTFHAPCQEAASIRIHDQKFVHGHTSVQRSLGDVVFCWVAMSQLKILQTWKKRKRAIRRHLAFLLQVTGGNYGKMPCKHGNRSFCNWPREGKSSGILSQIFAQHGTA